MPAIGRPRRIDGRAGCDEVGRGCEGEVRVVPGAPRGSPQETGFHRYAAQCLDLRQCRFGPAASPSEDVRAKVRVLPHRPAYVVEQEGVPMAVHLQGAFMAAVYGLDEATVTDIAATLITANR